MYGDQFGEFVCGYWDLKCQKLYIPLCPPPSLAVLRYSVSAVQLAVESLYVR